MKNIVEIKNVKCEATEEIGTMYIIASEDRDAVMNESLEHVGVSIFFQPEGEKVEYIKSFILTEGEARHMRRGVVNTIRDIGYILNLNATYLDILELTGIAQSTRDAYSPFSKEKILRATFTLKYNDAGMNKLNAEYDKDRRNHKNGFRLAFSKALGDMMNCTDDSIVPTIFPGEANVLEFDYMEE